MYVCVYIPTFLREQGGYFIKVVQFLNKNKNLRLDSDNHNNQNNSFQDIVNLQFILLCNA